MNVLSLAIWQKYVVSSGGCQRILVQVPLEDATVDVCVFCLSLMGTNLNEYLREANRILRLEYDCYLTNSFDIILVENC
jgi:hypothetical protein